MSIQARYYCVEITNVIHQRLFPALPLHKSASSSSSVHLLPKTYVRTPQLKQQHGHTNPEFLGVFNTLFDHTLTLKKGVHGTNLGKRSSTISSGAVGFRFLLSFIRCLEGKAGPELQPTQNPLRSSPSLNPYLLTLILRVASKAPAEAEGKLHCFDHMVWGVVKPYYLDCQSDRSSTTWAWAHHALQHLGDERILESDEGAQYAVQAFLHQLPTSCVENKKWRPVSFCIEMGRHGDATLSSQHIMCIEEMPSVPRR